MLVRFYATEFSTPTPYTKLNFGTLVGNMMILSKTSVLTLDHLSYHSTGLTTLHLLKLLSAELSIRIFFDQSGISTGSLLLSVEEGPLFTLMELQMPIVVN